MSKTIAVVDDEHNIRKTLTHAIEATGYAVRSFVTGEEVLEPETLAGVDLVVLDLVLPGIGGLEVLRRLRSQGFAAPVVVISAYAKIEDAVAAMKLGASDFLTKPFSPDRIRGVLEEALSGGPVTGGTPHEAGRQGAVTNTSEHAGFLAEAERAFLDALLSSARANLEGGKLETARDLLVRALGVDTTRAEALDLMGLVIERSREPQDPRNDGGIGSPGARV